MSYLHAKRYAQALFELSQETNKLKTIHQDISKLYSICEYSKEFETFLSNPAIPSDKRTGILKNILRGKIDGLTLNFLCFLESKGRAFLLADICQIFENMYLDAKNIIKAKVTSSVKLNTHQISSIVSHLKLKMRKEIEPECVVDEQMLGGIKLQFGDTIHDYSISAQLNKFKYNIIHA